MKSKWIALFAVVLAVVAIIAYKQLRMPNTRVTAPVNAGAAPKVLLVADLSEAGEKCACGEIIRAVREAQRNGMVTQEIAPGSKSELLKRYRVLTAPTVLFLDADGKETARYEGEDEKTVVAIRSHLMRMTNGPDPK